MYKEREDPQGGPFYNGFDRVRTERLWRDRLGKEADCKARGKRTGFQINLVNNCDSSGFLSLKYSHNRMELVTEKEIKQSPQSRMSPIGMDPNSFEVMAVRHALRCPAEKYDLPLTSAQETGWLLAGAVRSSTLAQQRSSSATAHRGPNFEPAIPGCLVHRPRDITYSIPALRVTMPANDGMLSRIRSAPQLPCGPPLEECKQLNNRKWYRPKGTCDVTTYANAYYTMNHSSPFQKSATGR